MSKFNFDKLFRMQMVELFMEKSFRAIKLDEIFDEFRALNVIL